LPLIKTTDNRTSFTSTTNENKILKNQYTIYTSFGNTEEEKKTVVLSEQYKQCVPRVRKAEMAW